MSEARIVVAGLEVENFRGLREARLSRFAGVNVLIGKNGTGKSSVLEALYIGLALAEGLGYVAARRGWFGLSSVESLFHYGAQEARVKLRFSDDSQEIVTIKRSLPYQTDLTAAKERGGLDIEKLVMLELAYRGKVSVDVRFYADAKGKHYYVASQKEVSPIHEVFFVDWNSVYEYGSPERAFSDMLKAGGVEAKNSVIKLLRKEYEGLHDVITLQAGDDRWVLHLVFRDRAIPYYVAGDGVRYALMYLMRLLTPRGAVLLLEEPELHMHPRLLRIVAGAIIDAYVERGSQVFATTHSEELVRMLLEEATERGLGDGDLKVYKCTLDNGVLESEEYTLSEARELMEKLEWDLRL